MENEEEQLKENQNEETEVVDAHIEEDGHVHLGEGNEEIDAGEALVSWETWEFIPHERNNRWYIVMIGLAILLIIYAIWTSNPLFALIIVMSGVMLLINSLHKPKRVMVHITTAGVVMGERFWPYENLKDFALIYRPPIATVLYINSRSWWETPQAIELEGANPLLVRDALAPVLDENFAREDEILTDIIQKVYKL